MSLEKEHQEALRWLRTAEEDLDAARGLLKLGKYSHACFLAQQSGEKALKALWYDLGQDPWGHSIQKLISEIPDKSFRETFKGFIEAGGILDRYYIPTRYPNGLPDLTPGQVFMKKDADLCVRHARTLLSAVKNRIARKQHFPVSDRKKI
ncbi:MAG TPA: HEPN domain-containing protein [Syntrophales bacterium]|nr:HEPN domain-containing protein [Syntrophales bacterium]HQM30674.1 HEPN domain-containing protein [Syntrophales bacterium]